MVSVAQPRRREQPEPAPRVVGFVFHLELKRVVLRLKQEPFAELLGVDRSVWYLIRKGKTRPPWSLVARVLELWPGEFDAFLPELIVIWGS